MSFRFGNITLHVQFGVRHLRLSLRQLSLGLIKHGLKWTRIDLEEELTPFDQCAFVIILSNQVTAHLRLNLCVDESFERSYPLALNRHIFLNDRCDFDQRWRRRSGGPAPCRCCNPEHSPTKPTPTKPIDIRLM